MKRFLGKAGIMLVLLIFLCVLTTLSHAWYPLEIREQTGDETAQEDFFSMDTPMTVLVSGKNAKEEAREAREMLEGEDARWSPTKEGSDVYRINHHIGAYVGVAEETKELIAQSIRVGRETNGALDITLLPVLRAWGFSGGAHRVPRDDELQAARALTGLAKLHSKDGREPAVMLESGGIELGATAKGYAAELVAERLRAKGITSALLNLGGNVEVIGKKPNGSLWKIGIRNPFGGDPIGVLQVSDTSVVTSAIDQRFFTDETGHRYWHIIDPTTGKPAQSGLASATIIMPDCGYADALSTAVFVMGKDSAFALWKKKGDFEMILVAMNGKIYVTEGIQAAFTPSEGFTVEVLHE